MKITKAIITESQLVSRLQAQDSSAFSYLYDSYSPALYGHVLRIVKKEEVAQELLHDVFMKVWTNIGQYTASRGRLFTWMFNLARNLSIDMLRSKEMQQELKTEAVDDHIQCIECKSYDLQQIDTIGIDKLLSKLQPEHSQIIILLYLNGYTHVQVANEYQIPLGTVKTWHRMAIIRLRQLLVKEI